MAINVEEQYDKIYRYCFMRIRRREAAEDITQETFLRFFENPQYENADKTLGILYTIAKNLCVDELRRNKPTKLTDELISNEDMEDNIINNLALMNALDDLTEEEYELVLMRYVNDVPMGAMSEYYQMSRFSLKRRLHKAMKKLKSGLKG